MLAGLLPVVLALSPQKVKYAVNCGGEEITTYDGVTYFSDRGYSGGVVSDFGKSVSIMLTKTPEIYQTERWAESDFSYNVPIQEPGEYVLILKFSEVWFNSDQEKIFSVAIGNIVVVNYLDIYSIVGKNAAHDEFIQFKYEGGKVIVNNKEATGAIKNGMLNVKFIKTDFDNPKVNGIVLFKGLLEETSFEEQKKFKRRVEHEPPKETRNYRKDNAREEETDFEDVSVETEVILLDEDTDSLLSVFTTAPALAIIALLMILGVAACIPTTTKSASKDSPHDKAKGQAKPQAQGKPQEQGKPKKN